MAEQIISANPPSLSYVPITFDFGANKANPYSQGHAEHEYVHYSIKTTYHIESGLRVIPNGGPPANGKRTQGEVICVHNGRTFKRAYFNAKRIGAKIILPDPDTSNPNEVLIETVLESEVPLQHSTIQVQAVSGYHLYELIVPLDITTDTLPMGVTPADVNTPADVDQNVKPADFDKRILKADHAVPGDVTLQAPIRG